MYTKQTFCFCRYRCVLFIVIIVCCLGAKITFLWAEVRKDAPLEAVNKQKEVLDKVRENLLKNALYSNQASSSKNSISVKFDKYTQSEAHLSLPKIKQLVEKTYDNKKYEKIKSAILAQEKRYKDYYVFYHGMDSVWWLAQDVYLQLYAYFNATSFNPDSDFIFLRFGKEGFKQIDPQTFLLQELKKNGLINDHDQMGVLLLATNLALFGNVGTPSECSWEYFTKSRGHVNPSKAIYEKMMNDFGLTHKHIDNLMSLAKLYETKEEALVQIFIPKDLVDSIGYLAWIKGIPANVDIMEWVMNAVAQKRYPKTREAIIDLTEKLKQEQENNLLFKNLINEVKAGKFALSNFLSTYRNNPQIIKHLNSFMARLIFTPDVLLNPNSGVKVFRYFTASKEQISRYYQSLNEVIDTILSN